MGLTFACGCEAGARGLAASEKPYLELIFRYVYAFHGSDGQLEGFVAGGTDHFDGSSLGVKTLSVGAQLGNDDRGTAVWPVANRA